MSDRNGKAEGLFDKALDYMDGRLTAGELEKGELKTILEFLDKQGINCVGTKNKKIGSMMNKLPVKIAVDNTRGAM